MRTELLSIDYDFKSKEKYEALKIYFIIKIINILNQI